MTARAPIDAERLVEWAFRDEAVDSFPGDDAFRLGLGSNAAAAATFCALGTVIDGGRYKWARGPGSVSDDAVAVFSIVSALPAAVRSLVIRHARAGTRPDHGGDLVPRLGPVLDDRGRVVVSPGHDAARNEIPRYCPVRCAVSVGEVNARRAGYAAWWEGLNVVALHFGARPQLLARWRVTGLAAPARPVEPWTYEAVTPVHRTPDDALPDVAARLARMAPAHHSQASAGARRYQISK